MLTQKDISTLITAFSEVFATKEELNSGTNSLREEIEAFRNQTFDRLDAVYKEVIRFREEETIHSYKHEEVEERLKQIEAVPVIAHAIKK